MKKRIQLILTLMLLCVGGIIGLQLYWSYDYYHRTVQTFERETNSLLTAAVEEEIGLRHQQLVNQFKGWLADTSLITITCDTRSRDSSTVFYIQDRPTTYPAPKPLSLGITYFKERLDHITPAAKAILINHVGDRILKADLQKGVVYYYTPQLGARLLAAFTRSQVDLGTLRALYKKQLMAADIASSFALNPSATATTNFLTRPVNTDLRRPYQQHWVRAGFAQPDGYFLNTMRGVILSTFLLIAITLCCFAYTARTLLSQHKLAELKDNFINNMTHELNTPLASIQLTTEALQTFSYPPEVQQEYLAIIRYQTQKLADLTAQVLTTNRLVAKPQSDWQRLDVQAILSTAIQELSSRSQQQGAQIDYQPQPDPVWARGDAVSLTNVFINLLDNALKYSPDRAQITVQLLPNSRYVSIAVADNGMGIPEAYTQQVFAPFFRVPQGNRHDIKGYGLGLSYVHQVVKQHHGSVWVVPNQPQGSVFTIKLPLG